MEQALRATKEDRLPMRAGKFAAGTTLTVTTVALAAVEAILSAAATLATLPVSYFVPERYAAIKTHTADSARTMALAAYRTFGAEIIPANQKVAPKMTSSRVSQLQELVKAKATTALQFGKENKTALIASAIAVTVMSAYYFGLFNSAASLVQSAPTPAKQTAKAAINIAQKAAEPVVSPKNLMCPVELPLPKNTPTLSGAFGEVWTSDKSTTEKLRLLSGYVAPKSLSDLSAIALRTTSSPLNESSSTNVALKVLAGAGCLAAGVSTTFLPGGLVPGYEILALCGMTLGA